MNTRFINRQKICQHFSKIAHTYHEHDFFMREIDQRMQERLDYIKINPLRILDLGCSLGTSFSNLKKRYPQSQYLGLDISNTMLLLGKKQRTFWQQHSPFHKKPEYLVADASEIPIKTASVNMVWSNLLLHWLENPKLALAESFRVLELGGLLMFSTLGPDTLRELRDAFPKNYPHTQDFLDMHDLGDLLVANGYSDPVIDMEFITLTYQDFDTLFAELRAAGSRCVMKNRHTGLTGKHEWKNALACYETKREGGRLPATFEIIYGHAWKTAPLNTADGRAIIRFR